MVKAIFDEADGNGVLWRDDVLVVDLRCESATARRRPCRVECGWWASRWAEGGGYCDGGSGVTNPWHLYPRECECMDAMNARGTIKAAARALGIEADTSSRT